MRSAYSRHTSSFGTGPGRERGCAESAIRDYGADPGINSEDFIL